MNVSFSINHHHMICWYVIFYSIRRHRAKFMKLGVDSLISHNELTDIPNPPSNIPHGLSSPPIHGIWAIYANCLSSKSTLLCEQIFNDVMCGICMRWLTNWEHSWQNYYILSFMDKIAYHNESIGRGTVNVHVNIIIDGLCIFSIDIFCSYSRA